MPSGENLRNSPLRDSLIAARKSRRAFIESETDEETDWPSVIALAESILNEHSKDLEVACWLTEALLHTHGASGLRDGLHTIEIFMQHFWESVHPQIESEEDIEVRAARLRILTDVNSGPRIPYVVKLRVAVADSEDGELINLEVADPMGLAPRREGEEDDAWEQRRMAAQQCAEQSRSAIARTSDEFYITLNDDLIECTDFIDRIDAIATERMGFEAPSWVKLRESIDEVHTFVRRILGDRHVSETPKTSEAVSQNGSPRSTGPGGGGPIQSRAEAIERLKECASYLRRNDPHSMVASLVDRAVHWAEMPLSKVLKDLIRDNAAWENIRETLGIPDQGEGEES